MMPLVLVSLLTTTPLERGATLFAQRCAVCHGAQGAGDGLTAALLKPAPANLTVARFSAARVAAVLRAGVPGTAMPNQADLSVVDRDALVEFVRSLGPSEPPTIEREAIDRGAALFAIRCAACHGERGDGAGPAARRVARPPADFTGKQPTPARVLQVLEKGIPGTAMTPMRRLVSEREIGDLVAFVQSVYGRNEAVGLPAEIDSNP